MGQAKRRKGEIEELKRVAREEALKWDLDPEDARQFTRGLNPLSETPDQAAAFARSLVKLFERAKSEGSIDGPMSLLNSRINATVRDLGDVPIACGKGCSHCCNIWVSASAPEVLAIAKIARTRGDAFIQKVREANEFTRKFSFDDRDSHPHPCPFLVENICSIYEARPKSCRLAASADAAICSRSYLNFTNEDIPTPFIYIQSRSLYGLALACALKESKLPHHAYEFNEALVRALDTDNAESAWLSGEDIFQGVRQDPADTMSGPETRFFYQRAFGHPMTA